MMRRRFMMQDDLKTVGIYKRKTKGTVVTTR